MQNYNRKQNCIQCSHRSQCFFNDLSDPEYEFLFSNKKEVDFKAGETIYKQGTESKYLVFLLSGMAKIYVEGDNGKTFILELIKPFQFLDIPAIFEDDMLYRSSSAVEDSRACLIDIDVFKSFILSSNKNIPKLVRHFNHAQSRYSLRVTNVIYKNMDARIADSILYLVNEVYFSRAFDMNISRSDLADLAGMSRESTSRILGQFKAQQILNVKGRRVEVLNKKQLEQIARYG